MRSKRYFIVNYDLLLKLHPIVNIFKQIINQIFTKINWNLLLNYLLLLSHPDSSKNVNNLKLLFDKQSLFCLAMSLIYHFISGKYIIYWYNPSFRSILSNINPSYIFFFSLFSSTHILNNSQQFCTIVSYGSHRFINIF